MATKKYGSIKNINIEEMTQLAETREYKEVYDLLHKIYDRIVSEAEMTSPNHPMGGDE